MWSSSRTGPISTAQKAWREPCRASWASRRGWSSIRQRGRSIVLQVEESVKSVRPLIGCAMVRGLSVHQRSH